jgi:hypothetical protein
MRTVYYVKNLYMTLNNLIKVHNFLGTFGDMVYITYGNTRTSNLCYICSTIGIATVDLY